MQESATPSLQIPTTIFSGFLGSGKTTIITHLVEELQAAGKQVIYIKNEIGDENIDADIMLGQNVKTKELLNGCICCTLVGPFIQAIDEIAQKFKPDRIIIEASGAADPAAIALMIDSHPKLERDGVIAVIDVVNFEGYKDLSMTARNQTRFTDLIVFNKIELADLPRKQAVVGYIRELNDHSPIVEAPEGKLRAEVAFGIASNELDSLLTKFEADKESGETQRGDDRHKDHLSVDGLETFHLTFGGKFEKEILEKKLGELPGSIYRIKGFAHTTDAAAYLVNKVGQRLTLVPHDVPTPENSLVFIGFKSKQHRSEIEKQLQEIVQ